MKKLLILTVLLCSLAIANAATFEIGWDASPASDGVIGYWVYSGPTNFPVRISYTLTNKFNLALLDGAYRLTVTSINPVAESFPSLPLFVVVTGTNVVAVTNRPGAPLNVQLR